MLVLESCMLQKVASLQECILFTLFYLVDCFYQYGQYVAWLACKNARWYSSLFLQLPPGAQLPLYISVPPCFVYFIQNSEACECIDSQLANMNILSAILVTLKIY